MEKIAENVSILNHLPDHARVWIYQSSRPFDEKEMTVLRSQLNAFVQDWSAHGSALKAGADIIAARFVVIAVDEQAAGASGCSIDKSVHFMQDIENQYAVQLFDRLNLAYQAADKTVKTVLMADFQRLYTEGVLSNDTLMFDNTVNSLGAMRRGWLKPLAESWHRRFLKMTV